MSNLSGLYAKGISKAFGARQVLDDLSLDCPAGTITGIVGRNGSGKSTLLRGLTGQLALDRGEVLLNGRRLPSEPAWRRARRAMAWTFQDVSAPIGMRVNEMVALARGANTTAPRDGLSEALAAFEHQRWSELSFGQRKLAAFAAASARAPKVLLLDEPIAGLSGGYADLVAASLEALKQTGCAIFLIEHDRSFLERHAEHVAVLNQGRIIFAGAPQSAFGSEAVLEALA
jgi:ABC-type branched-subunit amino acid transport system ATPase component